MLEEKFKACDEIYKKLHVNWADYKKRLPANAPQEVIRELMRIWQNDYLGNLGKAYENNNLGALHEAISFCELYGICLPIWVSKILLKDQMNNLTGNQELNKLGLGRYSNWYRRFKQDITDLERYRVIRFTLYEYLKIDENKIFLAAEIYYDNSPKQLSTKGIESCFNRVVKTFKEEPYRYLRLPSLQPEKDQHDYFKGGLLLDAFEDESLLDSYKAEYFSTRRK